MSHDQRNSYRCPVDENRQRGVLSRGNTQWPVRVIDESAGGFAVLLEGYVELPAGEVLLLEKDAAKVEVLVAHCRRQQDGTKVGLQRMAELPDPTQLQQETPPFRWDIFRLRYERPIAGASLTFPLVWLLLAAAFVGWTFVPKLLAPASGNRDRRPPQRSAAASSLAKSETPPQSGQTGKRASEPASGRSTKGRRPSARETLPFDQVAASTLDRLLSLGSAKTEQRLGLTAQQRRALQSILSKSTQELAEAYHHAGDDYSEWLNRSQVILEQSQTRAFAVLTEEQRLELAAASTP